MNEHLGKGIYGVTEAARYIGTHPARLRHWFRPSSKLAAPPLLRSEFEDLDGALVVSFVNLIDAMVTKKLVELGMTPQQIRTVQRSLQQEWSIDHPFSHRQLSTDGRQVFIEFEDKKIAEVLSKQHFIETVMEPFLTQVTYDDATDLAALWRPRDGVALNPRVSFGKPVIEGTGTTTFVVHQAWLANEQDYERVAGLYELTEAQVKAAVRFQEGLDRAA